MSNDILPPADTAAAAPFKVSDRKIDGTSAALGAYVFFAIYPAYELLRYGWGATDSMFSFSSTIIALVSAVLFGLNVRRRVRKLARPE